MWLWSGTGGTRLVSARCAVLGTTVAVSIVPNRMWRLHVFLVEVAVDSMPRWEACMCFAHMVSIKVCIREPSRNTNHSQNFTKPIVVNICPVHYEVLPSKPTDCCHMEKQKPETAASAAEATQASRLLQRSVKFRN